MTGGGRVEYIAAGAAIRQAFQRARGQRTTAAERDVLAAIVELVPSYSRLEDRVPLARLAECARRHPKTVARALKRLAALEIVVYRQGGRGYADASIVGLPRADRGALGGSPSPRVGERPEAPLLGERSSVPLGGQSSVPLGERPEAPPTEKTSEKTAEKAAVGDASDELPGDLLELLEPLGSLHRSQLERAASAWRDDCELVRRCVAEALSGKSPPALFDVKLTAARRNGSNPPLPPEERLERWLAGPGRAFTEADAKEHLSSSFRLEGPQLAAALERRRELAEGGS